MDQLNYTLSKPALLPVQYDEYCDIVGGQTWEEYSAQLSNSDHDQRLPSLKRLKQTLFGENNLLNNNYHPQRLILERFYIKTSLVIKLCQIVKDSHLLLNAPIGILNPETVRLNVTPFNTLAPNLWNYQMALCGQVNNNTDQRQEYSYSNAQEEEPNPLFDLYTIGIMLFRTLLVNDDQRFDSVKISVDTICDHLYSIEKNYRAAGSNDGLLEALVEYLDVELTKPIFQQNNISFKPDKSNSDLYDTFVWKSILATGFRLITNISEFSYYNKEAEQKVQWGAIEHVLNDLSSYQKQIKSALFIEPLNTCKDVNELLTELTHDSNWSAGFSYLNKSNLTESKLNQSELKQSNNVGHKVDADLDKTKEYIKVKKAFKKKFSVRNKNILDKTIDENSEEGKSSINTTLKNKTSQNLNETVIQQQSSGKKNKKYLTRENIPC